MLRPFVPFGMCAFMAALLAYLLTRPLDYTTAFLLVVMVFLLAFPLLMRWHYLMLVLSLQLPVTLFFIKGSPPLSFLAIFLSLGISIIERATGQRNRFIPAPQVAMPLLALALVAFFTAELTGGMGFHSLGNDVYGGKKYVCLLSGIACFFALTSRRVLPENAGLYMGLFLLGCLPSVLADLRAVMPSNLHFIYLLISASSAGQDDMGNYDNLELGTSRLSGISFAAISFYMWLLARYGIRGIFLTRRPWRIGLFLAAFVLIGLGGYRTFVLQAVGVFALLFYLEKLYRTPMAFILLISGLLLGIALVPLAHRLPFMVQRGLYFLPLEFNPEAVADAKASSDWRMDLWTSLLQEVPRHLLLGKGYAISPETFNELMDNSSLTFAKAIDSSQQSLAQAGDYHNGPLSVILTFGVWGTIAFIWFMGAGFWVLCRNYKFGLPSLLTFNRFFIVIFLVKTLIFLTVFGALQNDILFFTSLVGLNIAFNNGVCRAYADNQPVAAEYHRPVKFKRPLPTAAASVPSAHLS